MITEIIQFSNELDLLEAHLEQHCPWGWRMVIVESDRTIMGTPKPLVFADNRSRYERFDVEYLFMPGDIFPRASGYRQMRDNDWVKRRWLHANFQPKNPWVLYGDTDEILETKPVNFEHVDCLGFVLDERMAQVNRRSRYHPEVFRVFKSHLPFEAIGNPRTVTRTQIRNGWHFTNCPSRPEDMILKAQCRHWYFGVDRPEDVPGVEHFARMFGKPYDYITGNPLTDSEVVPVSTLPTWMAANSHLFPIAELPNASA